MSKSDTTDDTGQSYQSLNLSRRQLLQGTGAAAGTAAGIGGMNTYAVQEAEALGVTATVGISIAAGAAAGYVINEVQDHVTGEDYDKSAYDGAAANEVKTGIYESAISAEGANDTVLTTINNRLQDSQNVAWGKAKIAAIDEFDLGNSESTAKTAGKDAIDKYYTTIQKNLGNHFHSQVNKLESWHTKATNDSNVSLSNVMYWEDNNGNDKTPYMVFATRDITLADGSILTVKRLHEEASPTGTEVAVDRQSTDKTVDLHVKNPDGTDQSVVLGVDDSDPTTPNRFVRTWNEIENQISTMKSNIDAYVTDIYANYSPGEIDTSGFVDPTTVADNISTRESETNGYAYAGAELAMLGIDATFESLMEIYLVEDDTTVEAQLYFKGGPDSLDVGTQYSPAEFTGSVYIGWDIDNSSPGFGELEQSFKITKAQDLKGNNLDTVTASNYNTQTSDVGTTESELNKINDALEAAKEKQNSEFQKAADEGGNDAFGFSFGGGNGNVILLAGAGIAAYLIGSD